MVKKREDIRHSAFNEFTTVKSEGQCKESSQTWREPGGWIETQVCTVQQICRDILGWELKSVVSGACSFTTSTCLLGCHYCKLNNSVESCRTYWLQHVTYLIEFSSTKSQNITEFKPKSRRPSLPHLRRMSI